jgi:hypothetical protein
MKTSESIANIAAALVQFQSRVRNPEKKGVNPHFRSKYAELDDIINTIRPTLEEFGLAFLQNPIYDESGKVGVYTLLLHKSGEYIQFDPVLIPLQKSTPHQVGAALTYAKRYSLGAALGIATEEDKDGNDAMSTPQQSNYQSKKKHEKTEGERIAEGVQAIMQEVKNKRLEQKEFEAILQYELGQPSLKGMPLNKLRGLYKVLSDRSSKELKEIAQATMLQQTTAPVA